MNCSKCNTELEHTNEEIMGISGFPPRSETLICRNCKLLYYRDVISNELVKKNGKIYYEENRISIIEGIDDLKMAEKEHYEWMASNPVYSNEISDFKSGLIYICVFIFILIFMVII